MSAKSDKRSKSSAVMQESRTFVRWANDKLKGKSVQITNLQSDLGDGTLLLDLIECLTQKRNAPLLNRNLNSRQLHLERVSMVIDRLKAENVETISEIDPAKIVDNDLMTILSLLWSLILHYSIALATVDTEYRKNLNFSLESSKERFLQWTQNKIPRLSILNFSSDWKNGVAIGALINAIAPGLCSDWDTWNDTNYFKNTQESMSLAADWLNIQLYITPEELTNGSVDEKSLLTYLSQFPGAKLRAGAPLRAKYVANRISAYGPGIESVGPVANSPATFTVETANAGKGSIDVNVRAPNGVVEKADVRFNNDDKLSYSVSYEPKMDGDYKVFVTFLGKDIPNSPFNVKVSKNFGNTTRVKTYGPGLQPEGNYSGKATFFEIAAEDAGSGVPEVIILDPAGHKTTVPVKVRQIEQNKWRCEYISNLIGLHSVNIFFAGIPIANSPFGVKISSICDSRRVRVRGRGIQAKGIRNGDDAVFYIHTTGAGIGTPEVKIVGPGGINQNVDIKHVKEDLYECHYYPIKEGRYMIMVKFGKMEVPKAPFEIIVGPRCQSSIIAYGPGLSAGMVDYPAAFVVEMNGESGALGFSVAGPSQAEIECHDNGDGSALVRYLPTAPGEYAIHVLCDNDDITKSPFIAQIQPKANFQPDLVKCYGAGIQPNSAILGCSTEFKVDTNGAGNAPLQINIQDSLGNFVPLTTSCKETGLTKCSYIPKTTLPHVIEVNYGGVAAAQSPYRVYVSAPPDVTKLRIFGDWFEIKTKLNTKSTFNIDASEVDAAELNVFLVHDESGDKIPLATTNDKQVHLVELIVTKPGNYSTKIYYGGIPVPFKQKVYVPPGMDYSTITIENLANEPTYIGRMKEFIIDMTKTNATIEEQNLSVTIIDPNGNTVPHKLTMSDNVFRILFTPHYIGCHKIHIMYENIPLIGSPFAVNVISFCDPSKVKATGHGLVSGIVGELCKFDIETRHAGLGGLTLAIEGPSETKLKCVDNKNGSCSVEYIPNEPGDYEISVIFANKHIPNSPFKVSVTYPVRPDKVKVFGPAVASGHIKVGEQTYFNIDVSEAGPGLIAVQINNLKGVPVDNVFVVNKGGGLYTVNFMPPNENSIVVSVKFAHQHVSSSPFMLTIDPKETNNSRLNDQTKQNRKSDISLVVEDCARIEDVGVTEESAAKSSKQTKPNERFGTICFSKLPVEHPADSLKAEVKMPSGKIDLPIIEDNHDGTVRIQYDPTEEGVHELVLTHNGVPVQGSPYKFHVDALSSGSVTAYGPGLSTGKKGDPCNFTLSTKGAGAGGLSLSVEGPSKAKISYTDNKDGTISVSFLPTEAGDYVVSVRFGDKHITGSPFKCSVEGDVKKRNQMSISSGPPVTLPGVLTDNDLRSLNAIIITPSGLEEPCFLKRLPSGNIGVSFTPRESGEHTVSVKRLGRQIKNSPFKITVTEKEVGNAKKVRTSGNTLKEAKTHFDNEFMIDTRDAGYGGLSLSIEGPSKAQIKCLDQIDGTLKISYQPTEPGNYVLNLKFADHHVEGSPFNIKVTGEGSNRQRENLEQETKAVPSSDVGSKCKLTFKMPGITSFDLAASVTSPKGVTQDAEVQEIEDGVYAVQFVPKEEGAHTISVRYTELHIPGSPFQYTVGPFGDSGSHLVKAGGGGLEYAEVGVPAEFNVWTREAGSGSLAISIEGPSKAEIGFKDRKDGSCNVAYTVKEPGIYHIGLKFNERHIPDSPFIVHASPAAGDAHKLEIAQFPQGVIQPNVPSQFLVRKNGARGDIDAKIVSPLNIEDDCFVQAIDAEETSIRFYPREEGIHSIHVKLNGVHIPGSPYRVKVGKDVADPSVVMADGPGLKDVVTGQKTHFEIKTTDAGSGTLSVTVDGPAKVSLDCSEIDDGYKARYTPFLPGEYYISVKYNNTHIVGSPFKVNCTGKKLVDEGAQESTNVSVQAVAKMSKGSKNGPALPVFNADPSKVTVKGMGIKKAFLGKQNQFTVNASEAGHSILFVGLYNPKGPTEEVQVKHTGKNTFTVNYYIRERGEYTLLVMWGDTHIPGSPFAVEVPTK